MAKIYDDECGGEFNVNVKRQWSADDACDHNKLAYKVSVSKGKRTLWAPKSPMCVRDAPRRRGAEDSLAAMAMSFFSDERCTWGKVKSGPLKPTGTFDGARRRKRR
jgi:hypothetical protein